MLGLFTQQEHFEAKNIPFFLTATSVEIALFNIFHMKMDILVGKFLGQQCLAMCVLRPFFLITSQAEDSEKVPVCESFQMHLSASLLILISEVSISIKASG